MKSNAIWPTSCGGLGWHEVLGGGLAGVVITITCWQACGVAVRCWHCGRCPGVDGRYSSGAGRTAPSVAVGYLATRNAGMGLYRASPGR